MEDGAVPIRVLRQRDEVPPPRLRGLAPAGDWSARHQASAPISASTALTSRPSRTAVAMRSMSASGRSSRSRSEILRTKALVAATPRPGCRGARNSTACAPARKLDSDGSFRVRKHLKRLQSGRVAHRDVVLLAGAGRDRVHAHGMAQGLVLRDERGGDVLRDHGRFNPPCSVRNGGSPSERLGLTMRSNRRSEMFASSATAIAGASSTEGDGLAVGIPVGDDLALGHEDQRGCPWPR